MTSVGDRLATLEQHPDFAAAMQHTPPSRLGMLLAIGALLVPAGVSVAFAFSPLLGVPLAVAGAIVLAALLYLRSAPLARFAARVVDQQGRYVVLAQPDGTTREYRTPDHLRDLAAGDVGIAYAKLGFLLDFRRLR